MCRLLPTIGLCLFLASLTICGHVRSQGQSAEPPMAAAAGELPAAPQGVEVLARGPVHEAFATPTADPTPTKPVSKQPPKPLDEMPPEQKPEGDVAWIGGYWGWDDDRKDYLWVSGIWRTPPPGKQWVAGYWRASADQWQWVPGFWTAAATDTTKQDVTYLPAPPAPPEVAQPATPPAPDSFYVPGVWTWNGDRYAWRAGYWARVQPGYVWVAAHYVWTPSGYVFVPGYWDLAIRRRGVLFAPVVVDPVVVGASFVYTPAYVVSDTILVDALFVRPCYCHYYFGDYYGPAYREIGFESCIIFGRSHYDSLFVYSCWEHRAEPSWLTFQLDITLARNSGRAPCPPRTLVQQNVVVQQNITNVTNNVVNNNITKNVTVNNNVINNTTVNNVTKTTNMPVLVPAAQMAAAKGINTVPLSNTARIEAKQGALALQQVVSQRSQTENTAASGPPARPRVASLTLPPRATMSATPGLTSGGIANGGTGAPKTVTQPMTARSSVGQPGANLPNTPAPTGALSGVPQGGDAAKLHSPMQLPTSNSRLTPLDANQSHLAPGQPSFPPHRFQQQTPTHPQKKPEKSPPKPGNQQPTGDHPPSGNNSSPQS